MDGMKGKLVAWAVVIIALAKPIAQLVFLLLDLIQAPESIAGLWTKMAVSPADAILISIGLSGLGYLAWLDDVLGCRSYFSRGPNLQIVFPNECNDDSVETLFKRSCWPLPNGKPMQARFSQHQFFIGIRNNRRDRTIKNVGLKILSIGGAGPTWPTEIVLICPRTGSGRVDIQPLALEYFFLGEVCDQSDRGMFHTLVLDDAHYGQFIKKFEQDKSTGLRIGRAENPFRLLKNDGYKIELNAYGDDTEPEQRTLTVNARNRIEVLLDDSKG